MKNTRLHIVPDEGEWAIRREGSPGSEGRFPTQKEAIDKAVRIAEDEGCDVVVHRRDGTFRNLIHFETIRSGEGQTCFHLLSVGQICGLVAVGAAIAASVYMILHPPRDVRRVLRTIERHRPDWSRLVD